MTFELLPTIPSQGIPNFNAPAGALASRFDDAGVIIDRVYVSNGPSYLPAFQLRDGCLNQYLLNETAGTVAHDTGPAAQNGNYSGAYTLGQTGVISGYPLTVQFNGGEVSLPIDNPATASNGAFSFEYFTNGFNTNVAGYSTTHLANGTATTTNVGFQMVQGSPTTPAIFALGTIGGVTEISVSGYSAPGFTHVVGVYDGSEIYLYLNGALIGSHACGGAYIPGTSPIIIGGAAGNYPTQAVAFYPAALSASEILSHYNAAIAASGTSIWNDVQALAMQSLAGNIGGYFNAIQASNNVTLSINGQTLEIAAGIGYGSGVYSELVAGTNISITPSGSNLVIAATGGGGGGGALTHITSVTAVGSPAEIDLLSVFSSSYDTYIIELEGFQPAANGQSLTVEFGNSSGPIWETSNNYLWSHNYTTNSSNPAGYLSGGFSPYVPVFFNFYSGYSSDATFRIKNPLSTTLAKTVYGDSAFLNAGGFANSRFSGVLNLTTSYDSFRVIMTGSQIASGTVRVYGLST